MRRTLIILVLCVGLGALLGGVLGRWGGTESVAEPLEPPSVSVPAEPEPVTAPGEAEVPRAPADPEAAPEAPAAAEPGAAAAPREPADAPAQTDSVVASNNAFAYDLYRQLAQGKGNLFFSPYSISSALAMVYGVAAGETAAQLAEALRVAGTPEAFHRAVSELTAALNGSSEAYDLSVANALWGQTGYPFLPAFLELTDRYYRAGLHEVDYADEESREQARQSINAWVEQQTEGKIQDLIQPEDLSALTRLVLTTAIYFKGAWELAFDPELTRPLPFHLLTGASVAVPMMHQVSEFVYAENDAAQFLELPYSGGDLSMVVLLPRGDDLDELESILAQDVVRSLLSEGFRQEVEVFLPRFTMEQRVVLNGVLQGLGVVDAFDQQRADFSGMSAEKDLHISQVIHQSFVEVNEEGTEAAAATGVGMRTTGAPLNPPPVFQADRPFVFLIRDVETGAILFMGRVADPRG